jgi:hypothetical protein
MVRLPQASVDILNQRRRWYEQGRWKWNASGERKRLAVQYRNRADTQRYTQAARCSKGEAGGQIVYSLHLKDGFLCEMEGVPTLS